MFPKFRIIRQIHQTEKLDNIKETVEKAVSSINYDLIDLKEKNVGIAVGSRGISNICEIVKSTVDIVKKSGGNPVVFAAMGSHGGGTAQGQKEVLASLGITEETIGCKIETCAESILYGTTENDMPVYGNPLPLEFDRVILINRIKQHTDFEDITESGILKLMAIGIGNPTGARNIHSNALRIGYGAAIRDAGQLILKKLPVAFAVAITENWKHETAKIEATLPCDLLDTEIKLLAEVKEKAVRLPADVLDSLIVLEAGKNISGTCIDTKVAGRIMIAGQKEPEKPKIKTIAALSFTEESHGNAMGLGIADVITKRAYDNIDITATSLTGITSSCLLQSKIPCVAPDDYMAFDVAFTASGIKNPADSKAVIIKNTNALEYMAVSEKLYEEIKDKPNIETLTPFFDLTFDDSKALDTEEIKKYL